ncbi:MAG TPA: magnesium transporter [Cytophagales bacterium]|nr:magnesium transporter [Cytophagales bacterium]
MEFGLTVEYYDWLKEAIARDDKDAIKESMKDVYAPDITTLLYEFNSTDSKYVLDLFEDELTAEVITNLDPEIRRKFLKNYSSTELAKFIDLVDSDDAADILNEQPIIVREEVIGSLKDPEQATYIVDLLRYEEDCAGGLMAKELIKANVNWTVKQCIEEIRRQAENVEKAYSVYVVDDLGILLGRVSLKRIIIANDKKKIADIYESDVIAVETYKKDVEVAELMQKYDLEAIPVINVQGKLLGRITIDDVVDVITEQAESDMQAMSGISEHIEEDDSIWMLSRARLPWLIVGMIGGILGARLLNFYEDDIIAIPAMAFFIPLIMATGGNVGIQSSSLILQSMNYKSSFEFTMVRRFLKMFLVALLNGIVIASLVLGINLAFGQAFRLALVVSIALFSVVLLASFMGTVTPIVLNKFGVNPALASGPFITTANDIIGLAVYFGVAHVLYS